MAGSLQINGNLGQFAALTAANVLASGQTAFSWSAFVQVLSFTAANPAGQIFGSTPTSNQPIAITIGDSISEVAWHTLGTTTFIRSSTPIVIGQTMHLAGALSATGTSTNWLNGTVVATSTTPLGPTTSSANSIQIGWNNSALAGSVLLSNLAIWNGTTLQTADILSLRDGFTNPSNASTPATSWWTLSATTGAHPSVAPLDAGLIDQMGANNFLTISNAADATYSATSLPYISPAIIPTGGVYACRGGMIEVIATKNPVFGSSTNLNFTAVTTTPTFSLNGSPISVTGPYWPSSTHTLPCVGYMPYTPGSPPTPIVLKSTDVLTWNTADNWATTTGGALPAQSGTAGNYVGSFEPGFGGFTGFGRPPTPALQVGYNTILLGNELYSLKNVVHRMPLSWTGSGTCTSDGQPLTVTAAGGTLSTSFFTTGDANGVDNRSFPTPVGTYTVFIDEVNHANPMTATLTSLSYPLAITSTTPTITPGTVSGSTEFGRRLDWTVGLAYGSGGVGSTSPLPNSWNVAPVLSVTAPAGQTAFTWTNIRATVGGDVASLTPGLAISDSVVRMCRARTGNFAPSLRNLVGIDGATNDAIVSDLPASNLFSFSEPAALSATSWPTSNPTFSGNRYIPIYGVRPYKLSVSPKVFFQAQYSSQQSADSTYPIYPYSWQPAVNGFDFDWWFPVGSPNHLSTNATAMIEWVCADSSGNPVAHNLQTGQYLVFSAGIPLIPVQNANGSGTANMSGQTTPCYVTSSTTFITTSAATTLTLATQFGNVSAGGGANGLNVLSGSNTVLLANGTTPPIEVTGSQCKAMPGTELCFVVNHCLGTAGITALATRLFASTTRGTKICPQFSNEILLDFSVQSYWAQGMLSVMGLPNAGAAVMELTHQMYSIFQTVWGSDSASIVRMFQAPTTQPGVFTQAMQYAQTKGYGIDRITIAPYIDFDFSPTFQQAAAQMCADRSDSIANTGGPGGGQFPVLPIAAYADLVRHWYKYSTAQTAACFLIPQFTAALAAASYTITSPSFWGYEGGVSTVVAGGVSTSNHLVRAGLSHDLSYHPSMYDVYTEFLNSLQTPGPAGTVGMAGIWIVGLMNSRNNAGDNAFVCSDGTYTAITGTVSINNGFAVLTTTSSSSGLAAGLFLTITGDTSATTYTVVSGSLLSWVISPVFGGTNISGAAAQTSPGMTDRDFCTLWQTYIWQNQTAGLGASNSFWSTSPGVGGDGNCHDYNNQSVQGQSQLDWIAAASGSPGTVSATLGVASTGDSFAGVGKSGQVGVIAAVGRGDAMVGLAAPAASASFHVSPSRISPQQPTAFALLLTGTATTWTSGSTVTITNSLTGTTTVTKGTYTQVSPTSATLAVTTGLGAGTYKITIDGVDSRILRVGARQKGWYGRMRMSG